MEKTNISIILPIHLLDDTTKQLFTNAVNSVKEQTIRPDELVIVTPKGSDTLSFIKSYDFGDYSSSVSIIENDGPTDFSSQVNLGVSKAKSEWISILEYDDEYANIWFKNVIEYRKAHNNVDIFMPIIIDVDTNHTFIGFSNEPVWANSFSEELGILDNNALLSFQGFSIDGIVMKKSLIEDFGGFKSNIKLTFTYEFLLRMSFQAAKIMVIPKFGYKHINQRNGSLFASYKEILDASEARFWLAQAKKEYYHKKDREITYETQNV